MEITGSHQLHGLTLACYNDYHYEATKDLASGLAPQLKDITIFYHRHLETIEANNKCEGHAFWSEPRPFKELWTERHGTRHQRPNQLRRLSMRERGNRNTELLEWCSLIDTSCLAKIHLTNTRIDIEQFHTLSRANFFPSLKTIILQLVVLSLRYDTTIRPDEYFEALSTFFCSLPPLKELSIVAALTRLSFEAIIKHHGPRLKKLVVKPPFHFHPDRLIFTGEVVSHISNHCQILEDLAITIPKHLSLCPMDVACFTLMLSTGQGA